MPIQTINETKKTKIMTAQEKAIKNKSMRYTFYFNAALIIIALIPFSRYIHEKNTEIVLMEELEGEKIYTELNTEVIMSNETSTSASSADAKPMESPDPKPDPAPAPESKEVVTDNNTTAPEIAIPDVPNNNENINLNPGPQISEFIGTANSNTNGNGILDNSFGNAGSGTEGNGIWGNDNGDGKFRRKVISRPEADLKKLNKHAGTVVVRLAIDRDGKILGTKFLIDSSSIKNESLGKAAAKIAKKYKFDKDYSAPEIQYCNITIIFEK